MFFKSLLIATAFSAFALNGAAAKPFVVLPHKVQYAPSNGRWYARHDFTTEIIRAKALLSHMKAGYTLVSVPVSYRKGKRVVHTHVTKLARKNILLAIRRHDGPIVPLRITQGGANNHGFVIDWEKANGVNTPFIVAKPDGYTVLATRQVIRAPKGYREVVYTPFTDDIDTPEMRAQGLAYLRSTLERAYTSLLTLNVRSASFPKKRVAAIVPVKTALALSIIEHIDPSRLKRERIERLVDEVLVTVAANRDIAYNYAVSRTGARGLFQFMPNTYARVRTRYPAAHLTRNFVTGMNDHVNAAKASLLLFDSDLGQMPKAKRRWLVAPRTDPHYMAVYLAASYNGGAPRTVMAIRHGGAWTKRLRPETQLYIVKLDKVRNALRL